MNSVKKTQYNIKVDIHEVKDLSFRESANEKEIIPNPYIEVTVKDETKATPKKNQAVNVVYNTSFNFSVDLTDHEFQRTSVSVCVLHKYTIQNALIGKCSFGLNFVYSKIQHWLYRIWVKLRNPDLPLDDVGLLLISVGVYGPGDSIPIVNDSLKTNINEDIFAIKGIDIHVTHYDLCVNIFRGQDIELLNNSSIFSAKLEPYIKVTHNGFEESVKVIKNDPNPFWNLCIHIPTCTPCYDKNIIIEIINGETNGIVVYSILLDFFEILKREVFPRWFNIYYNPQNQVYTKNSVYTQSANPVTHSANTGATAGGTFMGNNLFSVAAEKIFKSAAQGININDFIGGVTKVQNIFQDDVIREPYLYGGRVYLGISAYNTHAPGPICIKSAKTCPDPINREYILCVDIYEILSVRNSKALNYDDTHNNDNTYISNNYTAGETIVCVCALGPHKLKTVPLLPNEIGSYVLNEHAGRIEEFRIFLPQNNYEQFYDIFLYIYVKTNQTVSEWLTTNASAYGGGAGAGGEASYFNDGNDSNMLRPISSNYGYRASQDMSKELDFINNYKLNSFVRIPYTYLLSNQKKPKWFLMKNIETNAPEYNISFFANLIPAESYKTRSKRLEYKLSRYFFRALIYEGLHFPAKGYDEFPDPYVKVELAGQVIKTSTILHTLNPNYYEAYEVEVILPTNLNLAPDISIEAYSVNKSFLYNEDILLGSCSYSILKVPLEWKRAPVWIDLKSSQYKKCKAKLLVAFELVPSQKVLDDTYPFYDDIRPSTLPGHVSLFLIGIRMFKPLKDPSVTVCFGRDVDDTSQFLWHETTGKVIAGKEGNWNFLKYFSFDVSLPKRMQHHSFLEVRVEEKFGKNTFPTSGVPTAPVTNATNNSMLIGTAYITLNPLLPWLDPYEKSECIELFKLHLLEEVLIEDAELARKSFNSAFIHKNSSIYSRRLSQDGYDRESEHVQNGDISYINDELHHMNEHAMYLEEQEQNEEEEEEEGEGEGEDEEGEGGGERDGEEREREGKRGGKKKGKRERGAGAGGGIGIGGGTDDIEGGIDNIEQEGFNTEEKSFGKKMKKKKKNKNKKSVSASVSNQDNIGKNINSKRHRAVAEKKKKKMFENFLKNNAYVPYNDPDFANTHIDETIDHVCIKSNEFEDLVNQNIEQVGSMGDKSEMNTGGEKGGGPAGSYQRMYRGMRSVSGNGKGLGTGTGTGTGLATGNGHGYGSVYGYSNGYSNEHKNGHKDGHKDGHKNGGVTAEVDSETKSGIISDTKMTAGTESEAIEKKGGGLKDNLFKGKVEDGKDKKSKNVGEQERSNSMVHRTIFGFDEEDLNFQLALADDDEQEEIQRDEMLYEYEVDMNADDLPYLRTTIFRCTDSGVPEAVGYLKYICHVYDENTMHLKKAMIKKCDDLVSEYRLTRNLVVRAYIIQARGLNPPSGATDITTYVWIKNSNEIINIPGGLSHNVKDVGHIKRQGYKPEFNRCYQLLCSLPDEAIVQVCIMNQGSISDEIIGYTYIDMEDRYFNKKIRQLMVEDSMPIELRSLKLENSTISHGSLKCWFEIFTEEFTQRNPIKVLTSNEPDDYQLRLVIWKVSNVAMDDNSTISMFVRCIYTDDDTEDIRDTDTHFNSKDGKGTFNWRFVYNIKIPTNSTNVKIQIHNYAVLSSNEPIGEATLDLSAHFYRARKRKGIYQIQRFWLSCKHPAHKNKIRGNVEIEGSILTKSEAEVSPVGNGRDEPNKDPYLPPVTENRTYVDWVTINEKFGAAKESIMYGLKWTGVWVVIAAVVVGILFILFLLK